MKNATSSNVLVLAAALVRAASAVASAVSTVSAVSAVDEDGGRLLITRRTIRCRSCRDTKRADHCKRRLGF